MKQKQRDTNFAHLLHLATHTGCHVIVNWVEHRHMQLWKREYKVDYKNVFNIRIAPKRNRIFYLHFCSNIFEIGFLFETTRANKRTGDQPSIEILLRAGAVKVRPHKTTKINEHFLFLGISRLVISLWLCERVIILSLL